MALPIRSIPATIASSLPAPFVRWCLVAAYALRQQWRTFVPHREISCFVAVGNSSQHLLLVRHSYNEPDKWSLPGGGMRKDEDPLGAARREVREELSCELRGLELKGFFRWVDPPRAIDGYVVTAYTDDVPQVDDREIVEARFFPLDALPASLTEFAEQQIDNLVDRVSYTVAIPPFVREDFVRTNGDRYRRKVRRRRPYP